MPQTPAFNISGGPVFSDNAASFAVSFDNPGDAAGVQAYEWYLDGLIWIDAVANTFDAEVSCGIHVVGVKVLGENGWTGTQEINFATCKTAESTVINGPETILINQTGTFTVTWTFTDGTTVDMTSRYTFTADLGGAFNQNVFTATGDNTLNTSYNVTITADDGAGSTLSMGITVSQPDADKAGLLVVDLYNAPTLTVAGLIDNSEVTFNHSLAHAGINFIPIGSPAASALILASDFINQYTLNWRFIFNLAQLKALYPATTSFVFYIKGCGPAAGSASGIYNRKNMYTTLVMTGSAGAYIPSASGGAELVDSLPSFTGGYNAGVSGNGNNHEQIHK